MTSHKYQSALINAAKTMVRVQEPKRLLKMIARFIVKEVGLTHTSILVQEPENQRFVFVDSKGSNRIPTGLVRLDNNNPVVSWFMKRERKARRKDHLLLEDVTKSLQNGLNSTEKNELQSLKSAMSALRASACVPGFYKGELLGILLLGGKLNKEKFTPEELSFFQTLANDASMTIKTSHLRENLLQRNLQLELKQKELQEKLNEIERLRTKEQLTYQEIVMSLAQEVYAKDPYTSGHLAQVERLGLLIAEEMGLDMKDEKKRNTLKASLHLHDVGKIGIPDSILKKPGPLTDQEWKIMRQHPVRGSKILEPLSDFKEVARIVNYHHENFDGTGYPDGLKGEEIPLFSRIISVVDAFHAIVSTRCYRPGRSVEIAYRELEAGAGTQFDPDVVRAFIRAYKKREEKRSARAKVST